jgi:hypothetical protein
VLRLFDELGQQVFEDPNVPAGSGVQNVSFVYPGPALSSGKLYQFRVLAMNSSGNPISRTENLRGVFVAP